MLNFPGPITVRVRKGITRTNRGGLALRVHQRELVGPHVECDPAIAIHGTGEDFAAREFLQKVVKVIDDRCGIGARDVGDGRQQHRVRPVERGHLRRVERGETEIPFAEEVGNVLLGGHGAGGRGRACGAR